VLKSDEKEPEEYTDSDEDWYKEEEVHDGLDPGFN